MWQDRIFSLSSISSPASLTISKEVKEREGLVEKPAKKVKHASTLTNRLPRRKDTTGDDSITIPIAADPHTKSNGNNDNEPNDGSEKESEQGNSDNEEILDEGIGEGAEGGKGLDIGDYEVEDDDKGDETQEVIE